MRSKPRGPNGGVRTGAGRPRKPARDKRSEAVRVPLTRQEKKAILAVVRAENAEVPFGNRATPASWMRDLALARIGLGPDA